MDLKLKLAYNDKKENQALEETYAQLLILSSNQYIKCKISTKKLEIERDRKDERNIRSLRKVEFAIKLQEGFLILKGHLSCSFRSPFGGEFFLIDFKIIPNGTFDELGGVEVNVKFDNMAPTDITPMFDALSQIAANDKFVFNIGQFDEFMEVFNFYKKISDEINNTATFEIKNSTQPYYFISVETKELYDEDGEVAPKYSGLENYTNGEGIIRGYKVPNHIYDRFDNDLKDKTIKLVDVSVENKNNNLKRILRMSDNLFVSNMKEVDEKKVKSLHEVELFNISKSKETITLSFIEDNHIDEKFLNLYDMGQKIKVESIEDSLKLISQGDTGAAMPKIKYLIGDDPMPSESKNIKNTLDYITDELIKDGSKTSYIQNLNESQTVAFLKAVDGSPVTLIKGPPGTGKTHVINAITQYITKELKEKVVISSQTHVAIDNVLDKLMENKDLIIPNRITNRRNKYSFDEIDKTLYKTWGMKLLNHLSESKQKRVSNSISKDLENFRGLKEIQYSKNMKSEFSVIGATTTTSAIGGARGRTLLKDYQWLIIDEVSKSPITEVLRYLPYVEKIILVGDDFQLSPLLEFSKEDVQQLPSYDEDMFEKLQMIYEQSVFSKTIKKAEQSGRLILLNENYRSLEHVLRTYNVFYDGALKNMREKTNPKTIQFNDKSILENDKNVFFVEPLGGAEQDDKKSHSRFNVQEALATARILEDILENVIDPQLVTASAIFPYAAQIEYFTKNYKELINRAKKVLKSFELDTVDAFQGRETDIVLVNTVITRMEKRSFLKDFKRINVSMSRAKDKLVVFGSRNLGKLEMDTPDGGTRQYFKEIIDDIKTHGKMIQINQKGEIVNNESHSKLKFA